MFLQPFSHRFERTARACVCPMHPRGSWAPVAPLRGSGLLPDQSNLVQPFWGLLTRSDSFAGLRESLTTLCACVHAVHASVWFSSLSGSPMCDTAPLTGKSGVADEFSAVRESIATLCVCAHASDASVWFPSLSNSPRAVLRLRCKPNGICYF